MKNEILIMKFFIGLGICLIFIVLILFSFSLFVNGSMLLEHSRGSHPPGYIILPHFLFGQIKTLVNDLLVGITLIGGAQIVILLSKRYRIKKRNTISG